MKTLLVSLETRLFLQWPSYDSHLVLKQHLVFCISKSLVQRILCLAKSSFFFFFFFLLSAIFLGDMKSYVNLDIRMECRWAWNGIREHSDLYLGISCKLLSSSANNWASGRKYLCGAYKTTRCFLGTRNYYELFTNVNWLKPRLVNWN